MILQLVGHHSERQARNPQAGTDAEAMGECWLLACTCLAFFLLYLPRSPTQRWHYPQCTGLFHILKMSHRPIWWVHLLIEVLSSQMILACVKMKHKLAFTVIIIYVFKVFLTLLGLLITTCYYNFCSRIYHIQIC